MLQPLNLCQYESIYRILLKSEGGTNLALVASLQYNLFWTGPIILLVDSANSVGGEYSVGPIGGAKNAFQHVFGITVKYYVKLEFRGIRTDRYLPNSSNPIDGGALVSEDEPVEYDLTLLCVYLTNNLISFL